MNKKSFAFFITLTIALSTLTLTTGAQTGLSTAMVPPASQVALDMLPRSDVVAFLDLKRLINEAAPKVLADNPAKLAEFNAHIDRLRTQTGIDARSFESVALGMRYQNPSPGVTTTDIVLIARGNFNSGALIAAGRVAAKGKYQEQKHNNATIYIFSVNDHLSLPGLLNMRVRELAVTSLDTNTLVFGKLAAVRATLDASNMRKGVNADLVGLATRTPTALMGFGANVPSSLTKNVAVYNDEISKLVGSIRQAYGAVGTTANGFDMQAIARTERPEQAQSLSDTINALKQFGGALVGQLPVDIRGLAQNGLDSLKIGSQGNETSVRLELQLADIPALMRILQSKAREVRP